MSRYTFTPDAEDDLDEIWEYIAEANVDSADRVIADIHEAVEAFADIPGMGHRRDALPMRRYASGPCTRTSSSTGPNRDSSRSCKS